MGEGDLDDEDRKDPIDPESGGNDPGVDGEDQPEEEAGGNHDANEIVRRSLDANPMREGQEMPFRNEDSGRDDERRRRANRAIRKAARRLGKVVLMLQDGTLDDYSRERLEEERQNLLRVIASQGYLEQLYLAAKGKITGGRFREAKIIRTREDLAVEELAFEVQMEAARRFQKNDFDNPQYLKKLAEAEDQIKELRRHLYKKADDVIKDRLREVVAQKRGEGTTSSDILTGNEPRRPKTADDFAIWNAIVDEGEGAEQRGQDGQDAMDDIPELEQFMETLPAPDRMMFDLHLWTIDQPNAHERIFKIVTCALEHESPDECDRQEEYSRWLGGLADPVGDEHEHVNNIDPALAGHEARMMGSGRAKLEYVSRTVRDNRSKFDRIGTPGAVSVRISRLIKKARENRQ